MPLPHFELSSSQYGLLSEALIRELPDPDSGEDALREWFARGLDPEEHASEVSELVFLGLLMRTDRALSLTGLGAAVHYRAASEAAEERLASVIRLVDRVTRVRHPRLPVAVSRLARGACSYEEALAEAARVD
ncbi:hypothetical protein AB0F77_02905 [Streptomyces sp. NPDC026672]|uniref:hypothetical protein n=1 Tax=unclassified Streptomyces TaxID=2593676 RepID=UPI0033D18F76